MKSLGAYRVYLIYAGVSSLLFSMLATYNVVYHATVAGLNPLQLVLVGTILEVAIFLGEVPTGIVADVYSRRLSVIIGVVLLGVGFIVEGAVPRFEVILLAQLIWGVGYTFTSGATEAWITDELGEGQAGRAFLRAGQVRQVTGLLGLGLATALALVSVQLPIIVSGVAHLGLAAFLIVAMPETGFKPTPREDRNSWQQMAHTFRAGITVIRLRPVLLTILLIGAVFGMASEGYDRLWQKNLLDNFALPAVASLDPLVWFGIINAVGMPLSLGATEFVRRRLDLTNHQAVARALLVINLLLIVGMLTFATAQPLWLALGAFWLIGISRSVYEPVFMTWINQHVDSKVRATLLSTAGQVDAIGQIAGGPAVGFIGLRLGVRSAIFTAGLLLTPVLALYARTLRREPESRRLEVS